MTIPAPSISAARIPSGRSRPDPSCWPAAAAPPHVRPRRSTTAARRDFAITVIADPGALDVAPDPQRQGGRESDESREAQPPPTSAPRRRSAALIPGMRGGICRAALAELIAHGATVRMLDNLDSIKATDGYRPSAALDRFVRIA